MYGSKFQANKSQLINAFCFQIQAKKLSLLKLKSHEYGIDSCTVKGFQQAIILKQQPRELLTKII